MLPFGRTGSLGGDTRYAFTDRRGGTSRSPYDELNLAGAVGDDPESVARNRTLVAAEVGLPSDRVLYMRQMHGDDVAVVAGPWFGEPPAVDALVTAVPGLALGVLVADCLPVLLTDPAAGVISAVHAGRRGIARGVIDRALATMTDLGADAARMHAVIGPSVCGRCYEVPEHMQADFTATISAAAATTDKGTPALDLPFAVNGQLTAAGVDPSGIEIVDRCTLEDPALFSYRRDGRTGRQAGLIWRVAPDGS